MKRSPIQDRWSTPETPLPASTQVRRWDHALILSVLAFAIGYSAGIALLATVTPGLFPGLVFHWRAGLETLTWVLTGTILFGEGAAVAWEVLGWRPKSLVIIGVAYATGLLAAVTVGRMALRPVSDTWHLDGPQLLEGREAVEEARRQAKHVRGREEGFLKLHPDLDLPKAHWTRHAFIAGSVGSGKTQILLPVIQQLIKGRHKALIYDVKGDFTSRFDKPALISPWDERSRVWDIGRDVNTPSKAAAFSASLIPEDSGSGKYWSVAAQQLLTGAIRSLQDDQGHRWGWADLAERVNLGAADYAELLDEHYAKAKSLIANAESQSTASVLASLAAFTRVIDDLAMAWGNAEGRKKFSLARWVRDDYKGRKQVIVQAGPDKQLTAAYISAMVNVLVPEIIGPQLPDDERGRTLAFILDELGSLGKIELPPLIDKGRSKGVVVIAGVQDLAQVKEIYGPNIGPALTSMVGTHIVCQLQPGETRETMAGLFGKRRVAVRSINMSGGAHGNVNQSVHEENRQVIQPTDLTVKLGKQEGKRWPHGFAIRAMVSLGDDPLILDFPGIVLPEVRPATQPAGWTKCSARKWEEKCQGERLKHNLAVFTERRQKAREARGDDPAPPGPGLSFDS
ncbi:MAG: type IV secretion system DNA-binding domain-containing protein [Lysobacteraceae bacterium]